MTVFQKVQDLLANEAALVEFANSDGEPISAGDISVSLKAAALIAAHGAAFLHV